MLTLLLIVKGDRFIYCFSDTEKVCSINTQIYLFLLQSHQGIVLFDVTDVSAGTFLPVELDLPGIEPTD